MAKIHILPEHLSNQIAAGEVVERPASVVKELMENSLDAGADRIDVEIEGGGTRLIRIIDNGEGMDEDDVLLSLERHGTSKIKSEEELGAISTLGFRGEAIPSIGSVSKLTITSRFRDKPLGTRAEIVYGRLVKVHEAGCAVGTIVEVRNLFGNTPARRKFLRTVRTELGHIEEVMKSYALAKPGIAFSLLVDGRPSIVLDASQTLQQRLATFLNYSDEFITVGSAESTAVRHLHGFLMPPEMAPNGPARMRLFVNGRAVKDRMMTHAAAEGLRGFLLKGKYPAGLLHLILPPEEVDVNVHPTKQEVRFRNSRDIHHLISSSVHGAMQAQQKRLRAALFGEKPEATPVPLDQHPFQQEPFPTQNEQWPYTPPPPLTRERSGAVTAAEPPPQPVQTVRSAGSAKDPALIPSSRPASLLPEPKAGHNLQVVGQFADLYIVCKGPEGLVVIDQHAAHERLLFEKLRSQFTHRAIASQQLLFPETVELSLLQAGLVEKHLEELEQMGFALREFGGTSYIISAIPALITRVRPAELLMDVLEQFGSERTSRDNADIIDTILSTMACRAAVKGGTSLSTREIEDLLERMAEANLFSHCPHGRPVIKQFSLSEIKKWFHRS